MKCSLCGEEEPSTCERPITLGNPGQAQTQAICDKCYDETLTRNPSDDEE